MDITNEEIFRTFDGSGGISIGTGNIDETEEIVESNLVAQSNAGAFSRSRVFKYGGSIGTPSSGRAGAFSRSRVYEYRGPRTPSSGSADAFSRSRVSEYGGSGGTSESGSADAFSRSRAFQYGGSGETSESG
ncbi:hypothetical protein TNCT_289081, partial [Trichonephila clavata]